MPRQIRRVKIARPSVRPAASRREVGRWETLFSRPGRNVSGIARHQVIRIDDILDIIVVRKGSR